MRFNECEALLSSEPLELETGVERLESGGMHIAVRMCLQNCTAEMLEYWFGSEIDSEKYKLWHPGAHKSSGWGDFEPDYVKGNVIGSTHYIEESLGDSGVMKMQLKYIDPMELFGEKLIEAKKRGDADVVLYGWGGIEQDGKIEKDERGYPVFVQYLGVGRNTPYGLVLRNHYWMGDMLKLPPEVVEQMVSKQLALYLMEHDSNEFHILGKVIPAFYLRDNWERLGCPEPYSKSEELPETTTTKMFV